ncbi:hypothetical protein BJ508DRAFT_418442 [Ascobolus immersus RN42]|uniref:Hypervirulence associated protein TUDOR domain-containing protein n=1 Tax=Ascobolus immersus RN42 TaxID=1160509 RepID=A0A3N4HYM6_ASCIM|nr:hypothetical protein BJ508DRAFT_418442 [Ascobolus immersus RN42]
MPALQTKKYKSIRVPVDTPTPTPEIDSPSPSPTPEYEASPAPLDSPIPEADEFEFMEESESESSGDETDDSPTPRPRTARARNLPARPADDSGVETKYRAGQTVEYRPIGGPDSNTGLSTGVIQRVLTSKTPAGDQQVAVNATPQVPQYEIRNNNTGKASALKGRNLMNIIAEPEDE